LRGVRIEKFRVDREEDCLAFLPTTNWSTSGH
jgi:hypothetical protein